MFSSEFTSLPIISPSSYNRGFAEEIAFPVMILFEYEYSEYKQNYSILSH